MSAARGKFPRVRVAGVAVRGDKILLVKHSREGRGYYLLPGGGLEWGETLQAGLQREFMEELSLPVKVGSLLLVNESIAPGQARHILNLTFHVRITGGTLHLHPDQRLREARWVSRRELAGLVFYPEIRKELLAAWKQRFKISPKLVATPWY